MIKIEKGIITEFNIPNIRFAVDLIPLENTEARSGLPMVPEYITIHNPASGPDVTGEQLTEYIDKHKGYKSWHLTVVDNAIFQELPFIEVSWNAGDGYNGIGNRKSVSLEIREDYVSENTAIECCAYIMLEYNIPITKVKPHKHWSGKQCPAFTLQHWDNFVERLEKKLIEIQAKPHWAEIHKQNLIKKGIAISDDRFNDFMTRGEAFALLDKATDALH